MRRPQLLIPALLLPAVLTQSIAVLLPLAMVLRLSIFEVNYISKSTFVGLRNFAAAVVDPLFRQSVYNSLTFAAFIVPVLTFGPLFMALLVINESRRLQTYVRAVFYLPSFASGIILATVWRWIFHPTKAGIVNWVLSLAGLGPVFWMGERLTAIFVISVIVIMSGSGGFLILYLATMMSVGTEMYDAARADGATWWQIKTRIIVPMISPTIALIALVSMIGAMQMWALVFLLTNGGPAQGTTTVMFDIYRTGMLYGRHGLAAAKSVLLMVAILVLAIVQRRVTT